MLKSRFLIPLVSCVSFYLHIVEAKEIALSFDDAPYGNSLHFQAEERTGLLLEKLENLKAGPVMVFAVACRFGSEINRAQLERWRERGHSLANHSCSHPSLHEVPVPEYLDNLERADKLLAGLFSEDQKFFRFPYLHEGKSLEARDQVREWLKANNYRNGYVSIDNDEWLFHSKLNRAKALGKEIDHKKVGDLYVEHILGSVDFYDALAQKILGRSPKHVLLLHEIDSSVLYIEQLVGELRAKGWRIIDPIEAYRDPVYLEQPKNLYANNGLIAQLAEEMGFGRLAYEHDLRTKLNAVLDITD